MKRYIILLIISIFSITVNAQSPNSIKIGDVTFTKTTPNGFYASMRNGKTYDVIVEYQATYITTDIEMNTDVVLALRDKKEKIEEMYGCKVDKITCDGILITWPDLKKKADEERAKDNEIRNSRINSIIEK